MKEVGFHIRPCLCAGVVHRKCLNEHRKRGSLSHCDVCGATYKMYTGMRPLSYPLEEHFMVVDWDCRLPDWAYSSREYVDECTIKCSET